MLGRHRFREQRLDRAPDDFAAVGVGGEIESKRRYGLATAPDPAMAHEERRRCACQSAARRRSNGIAAAARTFLPCRNDVAVARGDGFRSRGRFASRELEKLAQPFRGGVRRRRRSLRRRREENRELLLDDRRERTPKPIVARVDRSLLRRDVPRKDCVHRPAKVDSEVLDLLAVGDGEVGADPDQELVQREPLRPEGHELARLETRQVGKLFRGCNIGEDVLGAVDRREVADVAGDPRRDSGMPGVELLWPGIRRGHYGRLSIPGRGGNVIAAA